MTAFDKTRHTMFMAPEPFLPILKQKTELKSDMKTYWQWTNAEETREL
jgi:hypothetical protein